MYKIVCPFNNEFRFIVDCPYMDKYKMCTSIELGPGNGDSWCGQKVRLAIDREMKKVPGSPMRQNYSCNTCGLKSFVIYDSNEDVFSIATKIGEDHKGKEPSCPCQMDDLNVVGEGVVIGA
jgi:hypothetical protein